MFTWKTDVVLTLSRIHLGNRVSLPYQIILAEKELARASQWQQETGDHLPKALPYHCLGSSVAPNSCSAPAKNSFPCKGSSTFSLHE